MKICITAEGKDLDSQIDARFGRCRFFLIFDTEKNSVEAIENSNAKFSGGAGIQSGQLMVSKGVETVLTGHVGPNAFGVLQAAGIKVITNVSGAVSEAITEFKADLLKAAQSPDVSSKYGVRPSGERKTDRMVIKVDLSKCDGCGQCVEVCAVGGVKIEDSKAVFTERCIVCETCLTVCAKEALSVGVA